MAVVPGGSSTGLTEAIFLRKKDRSITITPGLLLIVTASEPGIWVNPSSISIISPAAGAHHSRLAYVIVSFNLYALAYDPGQTGPLIS
jgi:hypothetical protein